MVKYSSAKTKSMENKIKNTKPKILCPKDFENRDIDFKRIYTNPIFQLSDSEKARTEAIADCMPWVDCMPLVDYVIPKRTIYKRQKEIDELVNNSGWNPKNMPK